MIIVKNIIIKEYTHIEILHLLKNNKSTIKKIKQEIAENIIKTLELREENSMFMLKKDVSLINNPEDTIIIVNEIKTECNLEYIDTSKLIEYIKEKYVEIDSLEYELTGYLVARFYNNDKLIAETDYLLKDDLFEWLQSNDIVPTNSFKELKEITIIL